jgi:hypothetical protein
MSSSGSLSASVGKENCVKKQINAETKRVFTIAF